MSFRVHRPLDTRVLTRNFMVAVAVAKTLASVTVEWIPMSKNIGYTLFNILCILLVLISEVSFENNQDYLGSPQSIYYHCYWRTYSSMAAFVILVKEKRSVKYKSINMGKKYANDCL